MHRTRSEGCILTEWLLIREDSVTGVPDRLKASDLGLSYCCGSLGFRL